jgi:hypothetical protein
MSNADNVSARPGRSDPGLVSDPADLLERVYDAYHRTRCLELFDAARYIAALRAENADLTEMSRRLLVENLQLRSQNNSLSVRLYGNPDALHDRQPVQVTVEHGKHEVQEER